MMGSNKYNLTDTLLTLAGVSIVVMMLHIVFDVVSLQVFNLPIEGTLEFVANYYMVACVMLAMAVMQRDGGQAVVEIFLQRLSPLQLRPFDLFARLLTVIYLLFLTVAGLDEALDATQQGAFLALLNFDVLIWPTQWLVPLGFGGMLLVLVTQKTTSNAAINE